MDSCAESSSWRAAVSCIGSSLNQGAIVSQVETQRMNLSLANCGQV